MTKFGFCSLCAGLFLGSVLGIFMCYVALQHNPQLMYSENPENLIPIFFAHVAIIFLPFGFLCFLLELIQKIRSRKHKNESEI